MKPLQQIEKLKPLLQNLQFSLQNQNIYLLTLSQISTHLITISPQFIPYLINPKIIKNLINAFASLTIQKQLIICIMEIFISNYDRKITRLILDQFIPMIELTLNLDKDNGLILAIVGMMDKILKYQWHNLNKQDLEILISISEELEGTEMIKKIQDIRNALKLHQKYEQ